MDCDPGEQVGARVDKVTRFMPRCFDCGWEGPAMMRDDAEAAAAGHDLLRHPERRP